MTAQAYFDGEMTVRIFDRHGVMIADLPLREATDESADESLRAMRLKRRGAWMECDWHGREAAVRFCFDRRKAVKQ